MSEKRNGTYGSDYRPLKRRATSSPEEGEVDDGTPDLSGSTAHPLPPKPSLAAAGSSKFKVPFPFKKNNGIQSGSVADGDRSDWMNDRGGRRQQDESTRTFRQGKSRYRPNGPDSYVPSSGSRWPESERANLVGVSDSYVPARERSRSRERGRESDRHWIPNSEYSDSHERRHYKGASPSSSRRPKSPTAPTSSDCQPPLSPRRVPSPLSRSQSPSSRSEPRLKHRLPTPRSSALVSPSYTINRDRDQTRSQDWEREVERPVGDHYDPYERDYYRDRDRDPRGQYFREEADDWDRDRHYRPSDYDDRSYSRYPQSPAYRPVSPSRRTLARPRSPSGPPPRSPPGPPPPRSPPPPMPSDFRIKTPLNDTRPSSPSAAEAHRAREAQEFALLRPGAPKELRSPPSIPIPPSSQKATPNSVLKPPVADMPVPSATVKKRHAPVRRTREQEKAAYQRVFVGCGSRDDYDVMTKLGEGTFGYVFDPDCG